MLLAPDGGSVCLQRLALRCGYRICEICEELGCSERYLYEVFLRDVGLPPKRWMRQERMVVARRKLIGGKTPEEVAADLGFGSQNNFRREFRAFYKVPPLQFQRERWGEGLPAVASTGAAGEGLRVIGRMNPALRERRLLKETGRQDAIAS